MKKKKFTTKVLAEVAIFAALAFALDALQGGIFRGVFASGGSIGFAMVPILLISYRRGLIPGILCGLIVSLLQMLGGIYVINATNFDSDFMKILGPFLQIMLDYILAYTVVGFAGAFSKLYRRSNKKILWILVGSIIAGGLKYSCHILAGGLFWLNQGASFLNISDTSWAYSIIYNGAYSIPNIIICTTILSIIAKFYPKFIDVDEYEIIKEENKINEKIKRSLIILFGIVILVFSIVNFILSIEPYDGGFDADLDYIILSLCGLAILIYGILSIYSLNKSFDLKIAYYSAFTVVSVLISFYSLGCFFKSIAKNKPFVDNQFYLYTGILGLIMLIYLIFSYIGDYNNK